MNTQTLMRQFDAIGARLKINEPAGEGSRRVRLPNPRDFTIDIGQDRRGEFFSLRVGREADDALEMAATDVQPKRRHLLLLARRLDPGVTDAKSKFLCGHDERHWFVAPVPSGGVASVDGAMEALKPAAARHSQRVNGVKPKALNRRDNAGFVRQGEWFFLPRPSFTPRKPAFILRDEPLLRPGGKPHRVEELYREGGQTVYVCSRYPAGLFEPQYNALLARSYEARSWDWRVMRRNPTVYVRGKVRHPDHATIRLPFWHIVVMSAEQRVGSVVFLD